MTIAAQETNIAELVRSNAHLENTLAKANANVRKGNSEIAKADANFATVKGHLEKANMEIAQGNATISEMGASIRQYQATADALRDASQEWERSYNELESSVGKLEGLTSQIHTATSLVNALQTRRASILAEISRLEKQREPLLVDSWDMVSRWVRCTGSMEPRITCLDTLTWLIDFRPEEITLGAVISYSPNCWDDGGVAHRVIKIKQERGVYYFWPKGDASAEADGCWIPDYNVHGYVTGIDRNSVPENAHLRNMVNGARARVQELAAEYERGAPELNPLLRRGYLESVYRSLLGAIDLYGMLDEQR